MNRTIKELSEIELKAIKSDMYEQIETATSNLRAINTELAARATEAAAKSEAPLPVEPKKK